ncbi:hypothetical protein [Flavobacterium sp.]|uniref:hypothetical protein n=1 Tax=Flavobacterium sp. TaxID=239 RepID=UPI004033409F
MKPNLNDIIDKLDTDQYYAVRITDADKGTYICTNKTGADMKAESNSVEEYFNALYDKGVRNIVIQPRRRNGSSFVDGGEVFKYSFASEEPAHQPEPIAPTQQASYIPEILPGLGGNYGGLNALQAQYQMMDYARVVQENKELKEKNDRLSKKKKRLEREALENQFSESKANGQKELVTTLLTTAPALMGALKGAGVPMPDPGLASPTPNLTHNQQLLIEAIQHNKDYIAEYLLTALNGMRDNQEFGNEFIELLDKHNLKSA